MEGFFSFVQSSRISETLESLRVSFEKAMVVPTVFWRNFILHLENLRESIITGYNSVPDMIVNQFPFHLVFLRILNCGDDVGRIVLNGVDKALKHLEAQGVGCITFEEEQNVKTIVISEDEPDGVEEVWTQESNDLDSPVYVWKCVTPAKIAVDSSWSLYK
ncbi:unnamed protein product [Ambrosiozyma monospora]|uniref:Unnamed protein product n=1 Tax=Ambrosiozyma monospora TaxID=43982 RepID=A0ACB5STW5_AMBMO|nr:unnamed protein product [Ambrosiozyma monospora]